MTNEIAIKLDNSTKIHSNQDVSSDSSVGQSISDTVQVVDEKISLSEDGFPPIVSEEEESSYGWLIVLGAFLVQVTAFGVQTSWGKEKHSFTQGVMQDYYQQNIFSNIPDATLQLSFVGTLALVCFNSVTPLVHMCMSLFGARAVLFAGTIFISLGLEMAGFATQIWHLYLTQGLMYGAGSCCIFVPIIGVTPHWFYKRRGLALGIIASGSGIGGLIVPFIMTAINSSLGAAWTYRVLGFVCLVCDLIACLFVKEKNPPAIRQRRKFSEILNFSVLKDINFVLFVVASDIGLFGYFIPYFFLPSYATYLGLSDAQGSNLIAVSAACNFVGRIITGFLSDKIGNINTNLIFTFITAVSCLLIWTFASTYGSLMAFATVFGLTSGSFFALLSPMTAYILSMDEFRSGLTLLIFSNIIPVFGPNIASAIEAGVSSPPFFSYKMFAGIAYLVAAVLLAILKLRYNRNIFAKV